MFTLKLQWGGEPQPRDVSVHELCLEGLLFLILSNVLIFLLGTLSSGKSGALAVFTAYVPQTPKRCSRSRCAGKSPASWFHAFLSLHLFFLLVGVTDSLLHFGFSHPSSTAPASPLFGCCPQIPKHCADLVRCLLLI